MHALIILSLRLKGDPLQISGTIWSFFFSSTLLCEHYKLLCLGLSGFSTLSSQLRKTFWVLASPEAWELFPGSKLVSLEGSLLCLSFSGVIILCNLRSSVWKPLLCLFCCSCVVCFFLACHLKPVLVILAGRRCQMYLFWFILLLLSSSEINLTYVSVLH